MAALEVDNLDERLNLLGTFYGEIKIPFIEGLSYRLNFNTNYRTRRFYNFNKFDNTFRGSARKYNEVFRDRTIDNIITYKKTFNEDHNFDVTLVYGRENRIGDESDARAGIFLNQALGYNSLESGDADQRDVRSAAFEENALYQLGRLNYKFKDKYITTFSVRRDGFSGFGTNKKFGVFPSAAFAWVLSNEDFFANLSPKIDNVKLRASYGVSGNRTVGRYATLARVNTGFSYLFGNGGSGVLGQRIASLANNDIGWETTTGLNLGLDFGIFENRLTGAIDYYNSQTEDVLFGIQIPRITGFANINSNIGAIDNNGVEITLSSVNIEKGDFIWKSTFVYSRNTNEIVSINGADNDGDGNEDDLITDNLFIGKSIGAVYNYVVDGIYQIDDEIPTGFAVGQYRLRDLNDDDAITPLDDRTFQGMAEPAYRFSIYNEVSYKRFTLSFFINSIQGGKDGYTVANTPVRSEAAWGPGVINNFNTVKEFDFWTPSNPNAKYAGVRNVNNPQPHIYQQRNFVRLQDVNLSYNFSESLLQKYGIDNMRLFFSAKNLVTWTDWEGLDPETGAGFSTGSFPVLRSYSFGFKHDFLTFTYYESI